jgi:hypothetical protein
MELLDRNRTVRREDIFSIQIADSNKSVHSVVAPDAS